MNVRNGYRSTFVPGTLICLLLLVLPGSRAFGQETDCLKCHAKLKKEKVVHAAMEMGCATCHGGIDASKVPHRKKNKIARGLTSEQPDLCYGCHDKALFAKKNVHAAVSMGCTSCHNPHSSKNAKLLKAEVPGLCYACHDKKAFTRKTVHAPVAGGMCLSCHGPHASDEMALLLKKPGDVCLECHEEVLKKPHVVATFPSRDHPVLSTKKMKVPGEDKKWKMTELDRKDPARPGKPFYCGSCHDPHSTQAPRLLRFNAASGMDLCLHCHKV